MEELKDLPNLGPVIQAELARVGVTTPEQLRQMGSREAWLRLYMADPTACLHRLLALEGAVQGVRKADLPPETKAELRAFFNAATKGKKG